MTRDEAVEAIVPIIGRALECSIAKAHEVAAAELEILVALGVLNLDEPKSATAALNDIVRRHTGTEQAVHIMNAMKRAGLRVVSK